MVGHDNGAGAVRQLGHQPADAGIDASVAVANGVLVGGVLVLAVAVIHEAPQGVLGHVHSDEVHHEHVGRLRLHELKRPTAVSVDQVIDVGDELGLVAGLVLHVGGDAVRAERAAVAPRCVLIASDQVGWVADGGVARAENVGDDEAVNRLGRVGDRHIEHTNAIALRRQPLPQCRLADAC